MIKTTLILLACFIATTVAQNGCPNISVNTLEGFWEGQRYNATSGIGCTFKNGSCDLIHSANGQITALTCKTCKTSTTDYKCSLSGYLIDRFSKGLHLEVICVGLLPFCAGGLWNSAEQFAIVLTFFDNSDN